MKLTWRRSSKCDSGLCVEVAWTTSSRCEWGTCVQVGWDRSTHADQVYVRDSKQLDEGPILSFDAGSWRSFLAGISAGEFDR